VRELGRIIGALLLLALAGCSSDLSIQTSHDPLTFFPRQGTFAWAENGNVIPDRVAHLGLADLLPPAVEAALANRGWGKANPEAADLLVSYEVGIAITIEAASPGSDERTHAIGSISVALLDPKSKRRLWVGFVESKVHPALSQEERRARIEAALERLFKEFPP